VEHLPEVDAPAVRVVQAGELGQSRTAHSYMVAVWEEWQREELDLQQGLELGSLYLELAS
jgi:hypothetical protein